MGFINRLKEEHVREWYLKHSHLGVLEDLADRVEEQGYALDTKSGLFVKPHFGEVITEELGYTIVDIIFPRPSNYHFHTDVGEAIRVLNGSGAIIVGNDGDYTSSDFGKGWQTIVYSNQHHAFRPDRERFLEIRVCCTGILDPKKEVTVTRFDEFTPWLEYFGE